MFKLGPLSKRETKDPKDTKTLKIVFLIRLYLFTKDIYYKHVTMISFYNKVPINICSLHVW